MSAPVMLAETPEAMRREIANEPRLRRRPKPPEGRRTISEQRTFDIIVMRADGLTYAEIGRRVGLCAQRIKELCCRGTLCRCAFCAYWYPDKPTVVSPSPAPGAET